jgi:hypothetical protein
MSWIYQNKMFTDEHIPDGSVGFVYQMSAIIDGKVVSYIGKKNFFSNTKKKLAKNELDISK